MRFYNCSLLMREILVEELSTSSQRTQLSFQQVCCSLNSANKQDLTYHSVNPKYLTNDFEVLLHANATKLSRGIFNTAPLANVVASEVLPGSSVNTDDQWQTFVKQTVTPVIHPVGSLPMLPKADGGVVDPKLKVYGTANVRVVGE